MYLYFDFRSLGSKYSDPWAYLFLTSLVHARFQILMRVTKKISFLGCKS